MSKSQKTGRWIADAEIQVQFFDLDPMEIVWHGNYARYLEIARCALLDRIDYNYAQMKASGYAWPIIDMQLRYIGPAVFGQRLRVRAEIVEWEYRLKMEYLITDAASGQRINRATTTQVAVDAVTGEMCFVSPSVLFEKLGLPLP
ncbi:MAG: acyl-CoA thioesterase [Betaproteobacteria bacterium]|nr:acyl-CoA thioesterase [Betaproteobacteria bacterium]